MAWIHGGSEGEIADLLHILMAASTPKLELRQQQKLDRRRKAGIGINIARDRSRPVADVLKIRPQPSRTKVGNFLRHLDMAGALNFWKNPQVCRMVRVGLHRP